MEKGSHIFATVSYRELSVVINDACDWLASHGLDYPKTRVGVYRKHLNEMADFFENNRIGELLNRRDFSEIVNSSFEANDFFYIYKGLSQTNDPSLPDKLKDFVKGPSSYLNENVHSTNRGRNIAFELHIAARFASAGLEIDLTSDADLIVKIDNYELFIECKRFQKGTQIHSRVKGALKQLSKRYLTAQNPDMARGIIALSIGKVINPTMRILSASSPQEIGNELSRVNESFLKLFSKKWKNPVDSRSVGVLIHLGAPAIVRSQNLLTNCNEFALTPTFNNNRDYDFLNDVRARFSSCEWKKPVP